MKCPENITNHNLGRGALAGERRQSPAGCAPEAAWWPRAARWLFVYALPRSRALRFSLCNDGLWTFSLFSSACHLPISPSPSPGPRGSCHHARSQSLTELQPASQMQLGPCAGLSCHTETIKRATPSSEVAWTRYRLLEVLSEGSTGFFRGTHSCMVRVLRQNLWSPRHNTISAELINFTRNTWLWSIRAYVRDVRNMALPGTMYKSDYKGG